MAGNGNKDWRSSDNLRSQVAKLEADQRNIRLEVQHLRDAMSQGFRDINDAIERLAERSANRPTNWGVIASFIGVSCTILILIIAPLVFFGKENRTGLIKLFETATRHEVAIARLEEKTDADRNIREQYTVPEMKELSDQQRGAVKTAIDMNAKAINAINELRDEFLRDNGTQ